MPGFTGQELVKKVRADSANIVSRIIAITAHVQSQQQHILIADGFDECLIKPIMLVDLQRVIAQWRAAEFDSSSQYYAQALMEKVGNDRALGRMFLEKLMLEVPGQIAHLRHVLQAKAVDDAWAIAHKLHGSFSFYGFADFRSIAESLEYALLSKDCVNAHLHFEQLVAKFDSLQGLQADMKRRLDD
jgi:HPt (histidine-containing phosphotransfer) domain-containing protein